MVFIWFHMVFIWSYMVFMWFYIFYDMLGSYPALQGLLGFHLWWYQSYCNFQRVVPVSGVKPLLLMMAFSVCSLSSSRTGRAGLKSRLLAYPSTWATPFESGIPLSLRYVPTQTAWPKGEKKILACKGRTENCATTRGQLVCLFGCTWNVLVCRTHNLCRIVHTPSHYLICSFNSSLQQTVVIVAHF